MTSISTMKLALEALETCRIRSVSEWSVEDITPKNVTAAIAALRTAIQQAEAQQPATGEPVARVDYSERGNIAWLFGPQLPDGTELFKRPAPSVPDDMVRDAERGRFLVGWLKRFGLLQAEFGQIGAGEKSENWWLLHAPWGIDKTRPFFGHGKTPEQAIDAAMLAAK